MMSTRVRIFLRAAALQCSGAIIGSTRLSRYSGILFASGVLAASGIMGGLSGCVNRPVLQARSAQVEEAQARGFPMKSVEEERAHFFMQEQRQREKLLELVRARSVHSNVVDESYRLGANDELELNVFDVPELNITVRVRQSGFLSLPLIGAVKAVGLTEAELVDEIRERLATYVRNPQVSVFVTQYGSQKVAVMGAVHAPGTFPLKKGTNSLLELLSQAGGVNDKAGNFVTFIPAEATGVTADTDAEARAQLALASSTATRDIRASGIEIYVDQILGTSGTIPLEIPVRGGDMIVVPEAGRVMVEGEVTKPGAFELGKQHTLLGALASAGGITYSAEVSEIEVIRELGVNDKGRLIVDLQKIASGEERDPRLRNGDIVRVPSNPSRRLTQDTFESISKIINVGIGGSVDLVP